MNRRFLNVIAEDSCSGIRSLHRINVLKHLFYPSRAAAHEAAAHEAEAKANKQNCMKQGGWLPRMESLKRLPRPAINFQASPVGLMNDRIVNIFAPFGSESRILCADSLGKSVLFDVDTHSIVTMPCLQGAKRSQPITFSMAQLDDRLSHSLYVLAPVPYLDEEIPSFEVLTYGNPLVRTLYSSDAWRWHPLPPPPFFDDPGYMIPADLSYTVVGGSTICISSAAKCIGGTYTFDTASRVWRQASKWPLPFLGKAEYVPEFNLWFGISACSPYHLCALDLSASMDSEQPPTLQHTWDDLDVPQEWSPFQFYLVNLGSGKFCIAKLFYTRHCWIDLAP